MHAPPTEYNTKGNQALPKSLPDNIHVNPSQFLHVAF